MPGSSTVLLLTCRPAASGGPPRSAAGHSVRDRPTASATTRSARRGPSEAGTVTVTRSLTDAAPWLRAAASRRRGLDPAVAEHAEDDEQQQMRVLIAAVGDVERVPAPVADAHVDEVDHCAVAGCGRRSCPARHRAAARGRRSAASGRASPRATGRRRSARSRRCWRGRGRARSRRTGRRCRRCCRTWRCARSRR